MFFLDFASTLLFTFYFFPWIFMTICVLKCNNYSSIFNIFDFSYCFVTFFNIFYFSYCFAESAGEHFNKLIVYNLLIKVIYDILKELRHQKSINCHFHHYCANQIDIKNQYSKLGSKHNC